MHDCTAFSWLKPRHRLICSWSGYRFSFVHIIGRKLDMEEQQAVELGCFPLSLPFLGSGSSSSYNIPNLRTLQTQRGNSLLSPSCFRGCIILVSPFTLLTIVNRPFFKFSPVKSFQFHCTPLDFLTPAMFQVLLLELALKDEWEALPSLRELILRERRYPQAIRVLGAVWERRKAPTFPLWESGEDFR